MMASSVPCDEGGLAGRRNDDRPDSLRSKTVGNPIPPLGPNVADFKEVSMCGDEVECFKALLCASAGSEGLCGGSKLGRRPASSLEFVLRLRLLGFRFIAGIFGLMKDGEDGSDACADDEAEAAKGGWMERPFMFLRRGAGDVIGRIKRGAGSETVRLAIEGRAPKLVPGNALSGTRLTGESGEDEGDWSEREDESVHETVVVGDESADSEACVDVLSRWWPVANVGGWRSVD